MKRIFCSPTLKTSTKRRTKVEKKLQDAVEQGDVGKVRAILKGGTVVASKLDSDGRSLLHLAAARGRTECLEILLSYQLNVEARDGDGCTALHVAVRNSQLECVRSLVKHKVPLTAVDHHGRTALHCAAMCGCVESARLLCDQGIDLDPLDQDSQTPLMLTARFGHPGACQLLLDRGATVDVTDSKRRTALILACESDCPEVAEILLRAGADPGLMDATGRGAHHYALHSRSGRLQGLPPLVAHNATSTEPGPTVKKHSQVLAELSGSDSTSVQQEVPKGPSAGNGNEAEGEGGSAWREMARAEASSPEPWSRQTRVGQEIPDGWEVAKLREELGRLAEEKDEAERRFVELEGHLDNVRALMSQYRLRKCSQSLQIEELEIQVLELTGANAELAGLARTLQERLEGRVPGGDLWPKTEPSGIREEGPRESTVGGTAPGGEPLRGEELTGASPRDSDDASVLTDSSSEEEEPERDSAAARWPLGEPREAGEGRMGSPGVPMSLLQGAEEREEVERLREGFQMASASLEACQREVLELRAERVAEQRRGEERLSEARECLKDLEEQCRRSEEKLRAEAEEHCRTRASQEEMIREMLGVIQRLNDEKDIFQQKSESAQQRLKEAERHHREVISTYRAHLLNAAQGLMDEEVYLLLAGIWKMQQGIF
ncbi:ankyrin repeat domain-containing protein 24-like [Stegostoma tigrinum]|uniref:ankyrin repeat domain-containing protein 24-like n=1 Tax=Stegostoma tigrinum TaxID=3053191 RepID=UPI00286FE197|nr:ankyrin repeat domain-containing protein 24-like [Stegostoma tigrinum]